jgi:hypothetical protein
MYYPKSQITPNLYTNGEEFIYADTKEAYNGYYFKVSTGKYFTGRNQDDKPNLELILFSFDGIALDNIPQNLPSSATYTFLNETSEIVYEYNSIKTTPHNIYLFIPPYFQPNKTIKQENLDVIFVKKQMSINTLK